jgi:hypothetical protein
VNKELDEILEEYRKRPPTDIFSFLDKLAGPIYSWRMAEGALHQAERYLDGRVNTAKRSAQTRMDRAERRIEDLVVDYAVVILKKRREQGIG